MDVLPTLLGAVPDLGIGTVVVVVVLVCWKILAAERGRGVGGTGRSLRGEREGAPGAPLRVPPWSL